MDNQLVHRDTVLKTYRYLRLSMVLLVVVLSTSVIWASIEEEGVRGSISDYYYSSARAVFVSCLVAIGVGLIALRGNTDPEDVFLNLAGMLAPVVAFVPTPHGMPPPATVKAIENNVASLLIGGVVTVVVAAAVAKWGPKRPPGTPQPELKTSDKVGLSIALLMVAAAVVWLAVNHDGFIYGAHYTAAVTMFVFIALAVLVNTRRGARILARVAGRFSKDSTREERWDPARATNSPARSRKVYGTIFVLMLVTQLLWLLEPHFDQTVLTVEAAMILLFAVFWARQTWDLRNLESVTA
jgi:hypothetical protein